MLLADEENFAHGRNREHLLTEQFNQFASQQIVEILLLGLLEPTIAVLR